MVPRNDLLRQTVVLVSAITAIAGAFVGSGAAGGTPIDEAAGGALAADATAIAPGGPAFAVWSLIYVGLITYAIWQSLPEQKTSERHRRLGYPVAASLLLNAAWILSVQFDLLVLSVPIIVVLLAVLAHAFFVTLAFRPRSLTDALVSDATIGLYLGWVCVATAANIGAFLVAVGFRGAGLGEAPWGVLVMAITGCVGVLLAIRGRGRISPALALCWGLAWVAVARSWGPLHSTPTALAALAAILAIALATGIQRSRDRTRRTSGGRRGTGSPAAPLSAGVQTR
jgi:hypothetical protein